MDPQENILKAGGEPRDPGWGEEPESCWGTLTLVAENGSIRRQVPTEAGDYREYYANVRDAMLGKAPLDVTAEHAAPSNSSAGTGADQFPRSARCQNRLASRSAGCRQKYLKSAAEALCREQMNIAAMLPHRPLRDGKPRPAPPASRERDSSTR